MRRSFSLILAYAPVLMPILRPSSAQTPAPASETEAARATEAAALAKDAASKYRFIIEGSKPTALTLVPKPLLQWSNPVAGSIHGSVFVWNAASGRPEMVASIYKWFGPKNFHLGVEFHSLASVPFSAEREGTTVWAPRRPGLVFVAIPDAPEPADTAPQRLRQMRTLAKEFAASEEDRERVHRDLRLLTQPIYRYEPIADGEIVDGALFTFVEGTDPEVFLLIEARRRPDGRLGYDYALTRMNSVELRVTHKGREVWKVAEMPWAVVFGQGEPYTVFMFDDVKTPAGR